MSYIIESLVKDCEDKDYGELLKYLTDESNSVAVTILNLKRHHNLSEYQLREYQNYVKGFLFFLNTGSIPVTISKTKFNVFKPIISQLVADGMNASALSIFE